MQRKVPQLDILHYYAMTGHTVRRAPGSLCELPNSGPYRAGALAACCAADQPLHLS